MRKQNNILSIRACIVVFSIILNPVFVFSAEKKGIHGQGDSIISLYEDSIISTYNNIAKQQTDDGRIYLNKKLLTLFEVTIKQNNILSYPFDSLKKQISILDAPDKSFRIINWGIQFFKGYYEYYGYLIINKQDSAQVFFLKDKSSSYKKPEFTTNSPEDWFGALYYDIIKEDKNVNEYVLLGWDGNDLFTNRKIIDILWFDQQGNPKFGKPVFNVKDVKKSRIIFEYTEQSAMKLKWDSNRNTIVFDHLSPSKSIYEGHNEYYGSDFSFDGFIYKDDKWNLLEDIDVRNSKNSRNSKHKNR